ncbi:MAG: outer membrane beta-barrel protein [Flavobacteriales bacterium]
MLISNTCICIVLFTVFNVYSQGITLASINKKSSVTLSGYGDLYLGKHWGGYNFKESFFYNHKVNNKLRTNLLLLKGEFVSRRFHATLGLMTGDYSQYNLAAEPNWAKPLNEVFIGLKLSKSKNLWWDAGVYKSFIGIESAVSSDCPTLTRSMVAENSPYYLSGSRVKYVSDNKKHELGVHVLNGWQRIGWDPSILKPSLGAHYKYHMNENLSLMYDAFYGSIYPDSMGINRFYQHMNVAFKRGKWETWGTLDVGIEDRNLWGAAQLMNRYTFNDHWSLAQRLEVFYDPDNRCARIGESEKTIIGGFTLCPTYQLTDQMAIRLDTKFLKASENILRGANWDLQFNAGIGVRF